MRSPLTRDTYLRRLKIFLKLTEPKIGTSETSI
jgi:hypothetical protein